MKKRKKVLKRGFTPEKKIKGELYTHWEEIEQEIDAYLEHNPDLFKDKTVLLPCDDPLWSNFTKYFALRFEYLGLKKLISTSYAPKSGCGKDFYYLPPEIYENENFDKEKDFERGRLFVLENDNKTKDGVINIADMEWEYLEGDGDFRSEEVTKLRDEADFIFAAPAFYFFRDFLHWTIDSKAQFSILGGVLAVAHSGIFSYITEKKMWPGRGFNKTAKFAIPKGNPIKSSVNMNREKDFLGREVIKLASTSWYTNIPHDYKNTPLTLMTKEENLRYNSRIYNNKNSYRNYDNYKAIEVPAVSGIPSDYPGVMGVPVTFLEKYCPEQFEILGIDLDVKEGLLDELKVEGWDKRFSKACIDNRELFSRLLIKHKNPESSDKTSD